MGRIGRKMAEGKYLLTEQAEWAKDNQNTEYLKALFNQLDYEATERCTDDDLRKKIQTQVFWGKLCLQDLKKEGCKFGASPLLDTAANFIKRGEKFLLDGLEKKIAEYPRLQTAKSVFSYYDDEFPLEEGSKHIPKTFPNSRGEWVPIDKRELVAVIGNPEYDIPKDALHWNIQHGSTGWIKAYWDLTEPSKKMFEDTVYLVRKSWYEEINQASEQNKTDKLKE